MLDKTPPRAASLKAAVAMAGTKRKRHTAACRKLRDQVVSLIDELLDIDRRVGAGELAARPATSGAVWSVVRFLWSRKADSVVLYHLHEGLKLLERGITPSFLEPAKKPPGRKQDSDDVQELKGKLAGIARMQMESGMSRQQAASWVARKIPDELAHRLSSRGYITPRAITLYMDRYDCGARPLKEFEQASERQAFRTIFEVPTGKDDGSMRQLRADAHRPIEQYKYLAGKVSPRKLQTLRKRPRWTGLFGFVSQMCTIATLRAEGYHPTCEDLIRALV